MKVYNFKKDGNIGHIYIFGVITPYACSEQGEVSSMTFMEEFDQLEESCDEIFIHINCPGGDVAEGLCVISLIQACYKPTTCINEGVAFSMGAMVLQAGSKRTAAKGSMLMFHSASSWVSGNKLALTAAAEMLDKFDEVLAGVIADKSGMSLDDVKATYFDGKDHFMTAEEALANGFIDSITDNSAVLPKNISDFNNRSAVAEAYASFNNFDEGKKPTLLAAIRNILSPNNIQNMDEVRSVLALDKKADNKAIINAVNAIIKDRDDAKVLVDTLNVKVTDFTTQVTNLTTELNTAKTEQTRLQSVIDKFPDGEAGSAGGTDTPPGSEVDSFVSDSVTAKAQSIFNSYNKKS